MFDDYRQIKYVEMTKEEALKSLVEAGICTPDGQLVEYYRPS